ncbi:MAG: hypothetical protein M0Q02_05080, partial [Candidatus Muirbacterium halophilum]|nr:hypothetical protein [Candidatus Muirbacterium halophilum]
LVNLAENILKFQIRFLPEDFYPLEISKETTGFDVNEIFGFLKNISLKKGFIDYCYCHGGLGGYIDLYYCESEDDFPKIDDYFKELDSEGLMVDILCNIEIKDDINSIFEIVYFYRFADNVMFCWNDLNRYSFIVCNEKNFYETLNVLEYDEIPDIEIDKFNLDIIVKKNRENYLVSFVTWCNFGGLNREYFCLSRNQNNRICLVRKICEFEYLDLVTY